MPEIAWASAGRRALVEWCKVFAECHGVPQAAVDQVPWIRSQSPWRLGCHGLVIGGLSAWGLQHGTARVTRMINIGWDCPGSPCATLCALVRHLPHAL